MTGSIGARAIRNGNPRKPQAASTAVAVTFLVHPVDASRVAMALEQATARAHSGGSHTRAQGARARKDPQTRALRAVVTGRLASMPATMLVLELESRAEVNGKAEPTDRRGRKRRADLQPIHIFGGRPDEKRASVSQPGYNVTMSETRVRIEVAGQHVASGKRLHILPDNPIRMPLDPGDLGSRAYLDAWAISKEERDVILIAPVGAKRAIRAKVALYDNACFFYPSNPPVVSERALLQRDRYPVKQ